MIWAKHIHEPQAISSHYNDLDRFYREIWGEHIHHGLWWTGDEPSEVATLQLLSHMLNQFEITPNTRVCDVGCGYGATARYLVDTFGAQVTGFTLSDAQYAFAEAQSSNNPSYFLRDWHKNALMDSSYDLVIAVESSEHAPDKRIFFEEAFRVLRPGGKLAVCAWLAAEEARRWGVKFLLQPICDEGRIPSLATTSEFKNILEQAGFCDIAYEDLSKRVKRTWPLCIWRMSKLLMKDSSARRFVFDRENSNRVFAKTVMRIWAAYETRQMCYGIFRAKRPKDS